MGNGDATCTDRTVSKARPVVAVLFVVGSFACFILIGRGYASLEWKELVMLIVGALIANLTTVISWFFGSSEDSSKKTDLMAATATTAAAVATAKDEENK